MSNPSDQNGRRSATPSPRWLDVVRRLERAIGGPVERVVTSDAYFDALPHLRRAQAQLEDRIVTVTDDWYRLLNLPAGSEVRQLREQVSRMERQLERLTKQLTERDAVPGRATRKRDDNA